MPLSLVEVLGYFNAANKQGEASRSQEGNTQEITLKDNFESSDFTLGEEKAEGQTRSCLPGITDLSVIMSSILHKFINNESFVIGPSTGSKPNVTIFCPKNSDAITIVDTGKGTFIVNDMEMSDAETVLELGLFHGRNKNPARDTDISQDDPREELPKRLTMIIDQFESRGFWVKENRVHIGYAHNRPQTRLEFATYPGGPNVTVTDNGNGTVAIARTGSKSISTTSYERASALLGLFLGEHTDERSPSNTTDHQRASQAENRLMGVFEDAVKRGNIIAEQRRNAPTRAREAAFSIILPMITGLFKDVPDAFTVQPSPDTHTIAVTNRATQEKITVSANPDNTYRAVRGTKKVDNMSREDIIFDHLMPFRGPLPQTVNASRVRASAPTA
jgi:hypothetical protein